MSIGNRKSINAAYGMHSILLFALIVTSILVSGAYFLVVFPRFSLELFLGVLLFGLVLIFQTAHILISNTSSLAQASVFVFTYVFLWIAPIIQFTELRITLVNTTRYDEFLFLATNSVCALFSVFYMIGISKFKKSTSDIAAFKNSYVDPSWGYESTNNGLIVLACAAITIFSLLFSRYLFQDDGAFTPQGLFIRKYIYFIPAAAFLSLLIAQRTNPKTGTRIYFYLFILFICLLITQNPGTEKRNALGPVYLSCIYIGIGVAMRSRLKEIMLLFTALLIFFPITAIYTHARGEGISFDTNFYKIIADHFVATHYDAWANIYASIEIVQDQGLQFGRQLAGTLLFFIPSHIWVDKPQATGIFLGNYLIQNHTMWFKNLSSPLIAEAFIDFHILGVACYALLLAKLVTTLDHVLQKDVSPFISAMAIYWCFFLIFLLRGSLMIAFAYGLGASAAFLTIYYIGKPRNKLAVKRNKLNIHSYN